MSHFPGYSFSGLLTTDTVPHVLPRCIRDVESCFAALHDTGDFLAAHVNQSIKKDRYTHKNYSGGRARIHFQGMQRARDGVHAFVSGGDVREPAAHLLVLHMASRRPVSGWCSNLLDRGHTPDTDRVVKLLALSDTHWHGGGMALLGDLLAIPLEADEGPSRTIFLDVSNPLDPLHLPQLDLHGVSRSAGAVALMRLPNGFFLCAIHRDETTPAHLDFFLSRGRDLSRGWNPVPLSWSYDQALDSEQPRPRYQNVSLLLDADDPDDPNANLYLVGTQNSAEGAPVLEGEDSADLYQIDFQGLHAAAPTLDHMTITRVATKTLQCRFGWGNFAAVGGVHVDTLGRLNIYAGAHWRPDELIRFTEFRCPLSETAHSIDGRDRAWIELYEHHHFLGRRLTIFGDQNADLPDYSRLSVQGGKLDNQISSLRFQLPPGVVYRLFDGKNFTGASADLVGTGTVAAISSMQQHMPHLADRVSSSRYV